MLELTGAVNLTAVMGAGVYVLSYKGVIVYVGQSKQALRRLQEHRLAYNRFRQGKGKHPYSSAKAILFDGIHLFPCGLLDLDALERDVIERYKPRLNEKLKTKAKITRPVPLTINGKVIILRPPQAKPVGEPMRRV